MHSEKVLFAIVTVIFLTDSWPECMDLVLRHVDGNTLDSAETQSVAEHMRPQSSK